MFYLQKKETLAYYTTVYGKTEIMGVGWLQNFLIFYKNKKEADFISMDFLKLNFRISSYTGGHNILRHIFYQNFLSP